MKRHNLHTHTNYSDGKKTPEELIEKSRDQGLEILGISDHGFTSKIRSLNVTNLEKYIDNLKRLQIDSKGIVLKIGLEIDTCKPSGINPENLPFDIINRLDYVLFEYLRIGTEFKEIYTGIESLLKIRHKLLIPIGLAHPDLHNDFFGRDEEISKILGDNDIFVDMHLNFQGNDVNYRYSQELLEYLRNNKVRFTIGTDYHSDKFPLGKIDPVIDYIRENNLLIHPLVY